MDLWHSALFLLFILCFECILRLSLIILTHGFVRAFNTFRKAAVRGSVLLNVWIVLVMYRHELMNIYYEPLCVFVGGSNIFGDDRH